jgi:hypothetical protein
MPIESKFKRVAADDPRRCQGIGGYGQCPYQALEGCTFCAMHAGPSQAIAKAEAGKRIYRLSKWQNRVGELADHEQVKGLREEIGILRVLMEEIMAVCHDSTTLLMYSNRISDLATRIEKLVNSCHRLEQSSGLLLDKSAALNIGAQIVELVSRYVANEEALDAIGQGIVDAILKTQSKVEK